MDYFLKAPFSVPTMESHNDVTNLIPKGLGVYWLLFLGGGASIALLEFAYFRLPELTNRLEIAKIPPLDVTSRESLLNWGISVVLLITAAVTLLNFRLGRKYKDPRGRANAWFWTAALLVFLSMDVQVGFRETVRDILISTSGTSLYKDGTAWWIIIYGFFIIIIGTRIFLDMATYAPSMGLYLLTISGTIIGLLIQIGFVPIFEDQTQNLIFQTSIQAASVLFFFLAVTLFARRQVFRDPEVAMRWFAKVWKQSPMRQTAKIQQLPPVKVEQKPAAPVKPSAPVSQQQESVSFNSFEKDDRFEAVSA